MIVAKPSTSVSLLLLCLAKLKLEAELIIARDEETHVLSRSIRITHVEYVEPRMTRRSVDLVVTTKTMLTRLYTMPMT
jgi:hypothetical protein